MTGGARRPRRAVPEAAAPESPGRLAPPFSRPETGFHSMETGFVRPENRFPLYGNVFRGRKCAVSTGSVPVMSSTKSLSPFPHLVAGLVDADFGASFFALPPLSQVITGFLSSRFVPLPSLSPSKPGCGGPIRRHSPPAPLFRSHPFPIPPRYCSTPTLHPPHKSRTITPSNTTGHQS